MHVRVLVCVCLAGGLAATAVAQPPSGGPVGAPDVYVCTADATVLRLGATGKPETVASGTGSFDDCVFGPDGWLYISNGTQVVRIDTASTAKKPPSPEVVRSGLPSAARGLAFNGNVLYINTVSSGVWTPTSQAAVFPAQTGEGRGVAFEINGTFAAAYSTPSGGSIHRWPYKYEAPAGYRQLPDKETDKDLGAASPGGIAVNTCGDLAVADATGTLTRVLKGNGAVGVVLALLGSVPVNVEIDSSNRHYLLVADDDSGRNPRVLRADPKTTGSDGAGWISTCDSFNVTELASLKGKRARGLAIGPSAHSLVWNGGALDHTFDFGYHQAQYVFAVPPNRPITVTAHRVPTGWVKFGVEIAANATPVAYSPNNGLAQELVVTARDSSTLGLVSGSYSYYTQDLLGKVGIGRAKGHDVGPSVSGESIYTEDVQRDLWDTGDFDARSGEAENDFSKRVIYNAPAGCQVVSFSEPFNTQNPLFNGPQTIPITVQVSGSGCNGAAVRLSIVRLVDASNPAIETQTVRSNVQTDNVFEALGGGRYKYVLDATALNTAGATATSPAKFLLTVWGDVAPANRTFDITK